MAPLLGVLALAIAAVTLTCGRSAEPTGVVRVALLIPPGGPAVNAVHWQISQVDVLVRSGTIQTGDVNATPTVDTSCPAGSGYMVTLTATATDGTMCSGSSPRFNVVAGATVQTTVQLVCGGGTPSSGKGSVVVTATVRAGNNCPVLTSWEVSPLRTTGLAQINVSASASDADTGDVLTYRWTATQGSFLDATAATTVYVCGPAGRADLSVIVFDGHAPDPCTAARSFSVYCVPFDICGNGIVMPGEQCDPPNGTTCSPTCQCIGGGTACEPPPRCGDYLIQAGEQCDPPGSPDCNSSCQLATCGDGVVDSGEECDPPNGTTCLPGCIAARCGDGVVQPGEQCDPPDGTACLAGCVSGLLCGNGVIDPGEQCEPPGTLTCDSTCHTCGQLLTTTACDLCEQADALDCPLSLNTITPACSGWGCNAFTDLKSRTDCQALETCILHQNCMVGDDPTPCLCGTLAPAQCVTGTPNGPCAALYFAAAADAPDTVYAQFTNPRTPVGMADDNASCDVDSGCNCR